MHNPESRIRSEARFLLSVVALVAASLGVSLFLMPVRSEAGTDDSAAAALYTTHCAGCHQPDGEGVIGTFPPLAGNPAAADAVYVETVIVDGRTGSIEVLGVTYDAAMPAVAGLTDEEVAAITGHVVGLAGGGAEPEPEPEAEPEAPSPPPEAPTVGDADRGHDLFVGSDRLQEGGGACASCHTAADVGNLGGTSLGPDLTDVYDRFGGEAGTSAWLANPASPTMIPIFEDRPLTDAEIADLVAYLGDAPNRDRPSYAVDWLPVAGLVGLVVLIAGMAMAWRGMRQTYAQTLRSNR